MKVLEITGGKELSGTIRISGAKNSSVALIPAAILADDDVTICNVPEITDTDALSDILAYLGAEVRRASESIDTIIRTIEIPINIHLFLDDAIVNIMPCPLSFLLRLSLF